MSVRALIQRLEEAAGLRKHSQQEANPGERPDFLSEWVELAGETPPRWLSELLENLERSWPDEEAMGRVVSDIDLPPRGLGYLLGHLEPPSGAGVVAVEPPASNPVARVVPAVEATAALGRAPPIERTAQREGEPDNEETAPPAEPADEEGGDNPPGIWGSRPSWL